MIHRARLINILLAFQLILANSIQLEHSIIPIINSQDINNNGKIDFLATDNSVTPRTLYWLEVEIDSIRQLWTYKMPETNVGYFSDMILGDFNNDGKTELISLAYQENKSEIFYIFYLDSLKSNFNNPTIIGLSNSKNKIINPQGIQLLPILENNIQPFLLIHSFLEESPGLPCHNEFGGAWAYQQHLYQSHEALQEDLTDPKIGFASVVPVLHKGNSPHG